MDGLMLGFVARELRAALIGARVDRVLQPEKDELHLVLRGMGGSHRLLLSASANHARAQLTGASKQNPAEPPMFCMLLRKLLTSGRVLSVSQPEGDRILSISFECYDELGERAPRTLITEIMGRHSNIILVNEDGRILDSIHHVGADISRVREVRPGLPYTPPPAQNKLNPETATAEMLQEALLSAPARLDKALSEVLSGVGAASAKELAFRLTGHENPHMEAPERAALAQPLFTLLQALPSFGPSTLLVDEDGDVVDVFPFPQARLSQAAQRPVPEGISAALDAYYVSRDRSERMAQKSASLSRSIKSHIERCQTRLALHEQALADEARAQEAQLSGELLTANLHMLRAGWVKAEVPDYYTGGTRQITLDPRLTPSENAQRYYKQYQKFRAAQRHAKEQIALAQDELALLEAQADDLRKCQDAIELDEIRDVLVQKGYLRPSHARGKAKKPAPSKPLKVRSGDGLTILVGKNSMQNERLTGAAAPDAMWLHAKGFTGSHVIIDATCEIPETTLREAAMLAAWYSRGFASAQVPVDYTRRKFVKKPAGAAPGFVTYTKQRTLFVTPDAQAVKRLVGEGVGI